MAVKKRRPSTKAKNKGGPLIYEILGLLLIAFGIIVFFEFGVVGSVIQSASMFLLGNLYIFIPIFTVFLAVIIMIQRTGISLRDRIIIGFILMISSLTIFSHSFLFEDLTRSDALLSDSVLKETWRILIENGGIASRSDSLGGGMLGAVLFSLFHVLFDASGAKVAAWVILFIGIILITGKALIPFIIEKGPLLKKRLERKKKPKRSTSAKVEPKREKRTATKKEDSPANEIVATSMEIEEEPPILYQEPIKEPIISAFTQNIRHETKSPEAEKVEEVDDGFEEALQKAVQTNVENTEYMMPTMNLLQLPPEHDQSGEYSVIQKNAKKLEQTFHSFGVKARVTQVHLGPAVTKYEIYARCWGKSK